jgi:hypothetical protein
MPAKASERLIAELFQYEMLSSRPMRKMTHRIGVVLCGQGRVTPTLKILQEPFQVPTQEARLQMTMESIERTTMLDHGISSIARDDDRRRLLLCTAVTPSLMPRLFELIDVNTVQAKVRSA